MIKMHMYWLAVSCVFVSLRAPAEEETVQAASATHVISTLEATKWVDLGGAKSVRLTGSPDTEGSPFVLRIKFPDGARIPPHWHPVDENITVLSGLLYMGMGEKFDESGVEAMPTGSFGLMPKEMRHYGWTKGETTIQIHGIGPFKTYFINPKEDPRK